MKYNFNIVSPYLESSKAFPPWVGAIADKQTGAYSKHIFRIPSNIYIGTFCENTEAATTGVL